MHWHLDRLIPHLRRRGIEKWIRCQKVFEYLIAGAFLGTFLPLNGLMGIEAE